MNKRRWMLILLLLQVIMMAGCGENEKKQQAGRENAEMEGRSKSIR